MNMFIIRNAVPEAMGRVRVDPVRILWLWGMILVAVVGLPRVDARLAAVSLALTFLTLCLGHSVGLHRGIIHETYDARPVVRGALAWLFVLSGLGGPLSWARLHAVRDYWQNRTDCPAYFAYDHGLPTDFVWNLHCRFEAADDRALSRLPAGVLRDPWLRFLEATWPLHVAALAAAVGHVLGPEGIAVCVGARIAAGILGHWFVGYAAHAWGRQPLRIAGARESGTNLGLLGVASFGEGFHNNHHAFPWSARMGLARGQVDLGWLSLRALQAAGLVRNLRAAEVHGSQNVSIHTGVLIERSHDDTRGLGKQGPVDGPDCRLPGLDVRRPGDGPLPSRRAPRPQTTA
jgi:stearoyl-CoA desaturase (delta-9 desaturase)